MVEEIYTTDGLIYSGFSLLGFYEDKNMSFEDQFARALLLTYTMFKEGFVPHTPVYEFDLDLWSESIHTPSSPALLPLRVDGAALGLLCDIESLCEYAHNNREFAEEWTTQQVLDYSSYLLLENFLSHIYRVHERRETPSQIVFPSPFAVMQRPNTPDFLREYLQDLRGHRLTSCPAEAPGLYLCKRS